MARAAAAALGRIGREGAWIGAILALMALAMVGRIVLVLVLAPGSSAMIGSAVTPQLPWATGVAWLLGAALVAWLFMRRKDN